MSELSELSNFISGVSENYKGVKSREILIHKSIYLNEIIKLKIVDLVKELQSGEILTYEEIIPNLRPVKLYLDIEYYTKSGITSQYLNIIVKVLELRFPSSTIAIADASRKTEDGQYKNSFHVTVGILFPLRQTIPIWILHELSTLIKEYILSRKNGEKEFEEHYEKIMASIDTKPYNNGNRQLMRLPMSYKKLKNMDVDMSTQLKIIRGSIEDLLISNVKGLEKISGSDLTFDMLLETFIEIQKIRNEQKINHDNTPNLSIPEIKEKYDEILYILENLPIKYADGRDEDGKHNNLWRDIGFALADFSKSYNVDVSEAFHNFSKRSKLYNYNAVNNLLKYGVRRDGISYSTLFYYGRKEKIIKSKTKANKTIEEQIEDYKECETDIFQYLHSINNTETPDLDIVGNLHKLLYVCETTGHIVCKIKTETGSSFKIYGLKDLKSVVFGDKFILRHDKKRDELRKVKICGIYTDYSKHFIIDGIVFDPSQASGIIKKGDKRVFNNFGGFSAKYIKEDDVPYCSLHLEHIKKIWCKGDTEKIDFVFDWFARCFQKPAEKTGHCIILKSEQGAGKNCITNMLIDFIYGANLGVVLSNIDELTARFNSNLEGKLLCVLDECMNVSGGYNKSFDIVKNKITEATQRIEIKGAEPRVINDFAQYIITTNNETPVRVEISDRRYMWLSLDNSMIGNDEYFKALKDRFNQKCGDSFYSYFINYKIKNVKLPHTEEKKEAVENTLNSVFRWLSEYKHEEDWASSNMIYNDYKKWCESGHIKPSSVIDFGRKITSVGYEKKKNSMMYYKMNRQTLKTYFNKTLKIPLDDMGIPEGESDKR